MNPYEANLRKQAAELEASIQAKKDKAVASGQDLPEAELRSIQEMAKMHEGLAARIKEETEFRLRAAEVANTAARVAGATSDQQTQGQPQNVGGAQTQDRDPGHYRSAKDGGQNSFFVDLFRSQKLGDENATKRLAEHNRAMATTHSRALDTANHAVGLMPPRWFVDEFTKQARQGRALANAVNNIPLGDDPRPIVIPKQTAGAGSTTVTEQAAENDPVPNTDFYDTDVDTIAPKLTAGKTEVSRQMLDMSSPAVDQLIYQDVIEAYDDIVESRVGTAVLTAGLSASLSATFANEAAFDDPEDVLAAVVQAGIDVRSARKRPATLLAMRTRRWGEFKKLVDTTGRPIIPSGSGGPVNVIGVGTVNSDGIIEEFPTVVTDGMGTSAYPEYFAALRASDVLLFESAISRFRYEEPKGPETIILGIYAYMATFVKYSTLSVRLVKITAAT